MLRGAPVLPCAPSTICSSPRLSAPPYWARKISVCPSIGWKIILSATALVPCAAISAGSGTTHCATPSAPRRREPRAPLLVEGLPPRVDRLPGELEVLRAAVAPDGEDVVRAGLRCPD